MTIAPYATASASIETAHDKMLGGDNHHDLMLLSVKMICQFCPEREFDEMSATLCKIQVDRCTGHAPSATEPH
jgi:hypothetical protein